MMYSSDLSTQIYDDTEELRRDYPVEFVTKDGLTHEIDDLVVDRVNGKVYLREA